MMPGQNNEQLDEAVATTSKEDINTNEQPQVPKADDSNVLWDDSLISASFDNQLCLLENSIKLPQKTPIKEEQHHSTESHKGESSRSRKRNKKHSNSDTTPGTNKSIGSRPEFKNKSLLFRFDGDNNHNKETPPKNQSNETKRKELAFTETQKFTTNNLMPPPFTANLAKPENEQEAHASMLMAWYVAGYHTGYYEAIKNFESK